MTSVADNPYPYLYEDREDFVKKFEEMLDNPIEYNTEDIAKIFGKKEYPSGLMVGKMWII